MQRLDASTSPVGVTMLRSIKLDANGSLDGSMQPRRLDAASMARCSQNTQHIHSTHCKGHSHCTLHEHRASITRPLNWKRQALLRLPLVCLIMVVSGAVLLGLQHLHGTNLKEHSSSLHEQQCLDLLQLANAQRRQTLLVLRQPLACLILVVSGAVLLSTAPS